MDAPPLRLSPDAAARTAAVALRLADHAAGDPWGFDRPEGAPPLDEPRLRAIAKQAERYRRATASDLQWLGVLADWYRPVEPGRRHRDDG